MITHSPEQTYQLGESLGEICRGGEVIALNGELGSGKTLLTQGIAAGLKVKDPIHSPTFTLVNEYAGAIELYHADFYRLEREPEVSALGLEEYVTQKGVLVIEWADKFTNSLPLSRLEIYLKTISDTDREIHFQAVGLIPSHLHAWISGYEGIS